MLTWNFKYGKPALLRWYCKIQCNSIRLLIGHLHIISLTFVPHYRRANLHRRGNSQMPQLACRRHGCEQLDFGWCLGVTVGSRTTSNVLFLSFWVLTWACHHPEYFYLPWVLFMLIEHIRNRILLVTIFMRIFVFLSRYFGHHQMIAAHIKYFRRVLQKQ